jgi:signal transduction histidine kinase
MAALGGLVAGIAHEVNTPLGVGITAASYLADQTREIEQRYRGCTMKRSDLENYLGAAREAAGMLLTNLQRAVDLIRGFKQVAVDQTSEEKRRFKMKDYLDEVLLSLHPKLKKTPHIITVTCPENLEIESYPGAFSQILTNFVINSLIHGFVSDIPGKIGLHIHEEQGTLLIRYSDNGKGMSTQECSRIFEPFYTTKRGQGGSGLGLHIVYNLVTQRLNGSITCESTPGEGTTFMIQIPLNIRETHKK